MKWLFSALFSGVMCVITALLCLHSRNQQERNHFIMPLKLTLCSGSVMPGMPSDLINVFTFIFLCLVPCMPLWPFNLRAFRITSVIFPPLFLSILLQYNTTQQTKSFFFFGPPESLKNQIVKINSKLTWLVTLVFVKEDELSRSEMHLFKKKNACGASWQLWGWGGGAVPGENEDWIALLRMLFKSKMYQPLIVH